MIKLKESLSKALYLSRSTGSTA